jgi:hypothetical protein
MARAKRMKGYGKTRDERNDWWDDLFEDEYDRWKETFDESA